MHLEAGVGPSSPETYNQQTWRTTMNQGNRITFEDHHRQHGNYWQAQYFEDSRVQKRCFKTWKVRRKRHWAFYSFPHVLHTNSSYYSLTWENHYAIYSFLPWAEQSTYIISFVSHVRTTLATLQALTSFWPYAHSSHLGFFLVWWRRGGRGGTFYLHHQFCFTRWHDSCHSTGSYFFLALCSQQTFRVYWGGGEAGEHFTYHQFCFTGWNDSCHSIYRLLLLSGLMLTATI